MVLRFDACNVKPTAAQPSPPVAALCQRGQATCMMSWLDNCRLKKSTFYDSNALIGYSFMRFRGDNAIGGSLSGQFAPTLQTQARAASAVCLVASHTLQYKRLTDFHHIQVELQLNTASLI